MPNVVKTARQFPWQVVHYLRKNVQSPRDKGKVLTVGTIPAGSLIVKPMSGVQVVTAFTDGTNKLIDIGFYDSATTDDDYFGTDLSLAAATFVPLDEAVGLFRVANDTVITATPDLTGTAGVGEGEIVIAYIPNNDG